MVPSFLITEQVKNLRKIFWSNGIEKIAVHNFSVDVYEGQVTALLGTANLMPKLI